MGEGQAGRLGQHPLGRLSFSDRAEQELLSRQERRKLAKLEQILEQQRAAIQTQLSSLDSSLTDLLIAWEDVLHSMHALEKIAVYRDGLRDGFMLASFFYTGKVD